MVCGEEPDRQLHLHSSAPPMFHTIPSPNAAARTLWCKDREPALRHQYAFPAEPEPGSGPVGTPAAVRVVTAGGSERCIRIHRNCASL